MHTLIIILFLSLSKMSEEIKKGCTKYLYCLLYFNARNHHHHVSLLFCSQSPSLCPHHPLPFRSQPPHNPKGTIITTTHREKKTRSRSHSTLLFQKLVLLQQSKKFALLLYAPPTSYHHFLLLCELCSCIVYD
ncbi:hypothetical protein MtrunA17_Chr6g0451611 [Medicago truncatula]|uniref:Transmembrane protein n=1 Tax=Medicago truncatula TaxID=3880 RepID=A0A396HDL6_MEDTR|nr:hypothetical protein MtrunA17_Chr6g0451611 [Medicago truncatula]